VGKELLSRAGSVSRYNASNAATMRSNEYSRSMVVLAAAAVAEAAEVSVKSLIIAVATARF
jgi:hypothetical protein